MSDSDPEGKKPGVPLWQLKSQEKKESMEESTEPAPTPESTSRDEVLEQAKKFLEEDEAKDASTDKKIAFLESKGVRSEEITELLGVTRNTEASNPAPSQAPQTQSPASVKPPTPQVSSPIQARQPYTQAPSAPQGPPIITYPEFLVTPQERKPLVTKPRLLATLYAFGALSTILYGTNTYLVTPMIESLTKSRLSLNSTATSNLEKLIAKLESLVSTIPIYTPKQQSIQVGDDIIGGDESEDEDPTELFHRDIGVQTSPSHSQNPSRPGSPVPDSVTEINKHVSRLSTLSTHINGLVSDSTSEGQDTSELETTIGVLREYLDGIAYTPPSYGYGLSGSFGGYNGSGDGKDKENDEIAKVKAGIRGVKGVLLSARSFPRGVAVGGGGVR
ncbi:uncharacterized protein BP5553_00220 [Venustampulla echinocandica]|uniref:Peroxisomal membrane protein PEX14 n=1 Tax=Venustampulla echinocandica TaxID=2656787 RepID=A0A370TXI4_9HELO|nr:uncharacterized protein BP5553_00220 [Venustampulla echinocandica]RDL40241.1 hypothetical protein BP5553_00220 [Venustampulla echinocandica]